MKLAVRPFAAAPARTAHFRGVPSVSALLKTEPAGASLRLSAFLAGLILAVSLALVAEVAVYAAAGAAFNLVSKAYHQVILSRDDTDKVVRTSDDEIAKTSAPSVKSSTVKRQTSLPTDQQISTHKTTPDCLGNVHTCN